jgi:hypothetical protein
MWRHVGDYIRLDNGSTEEEDTEMPSDDEDENA